MDIVPNGIYLSRNAIPLKVTSDKFRHVTYDAGYIVCAVNGPPADGDILVIGWSHNGSEYEVTLTFTASPDGSGNQVALMAGGTVQDYLDSVFKEAVLLHPLLNGFFDYHGYHPTYGPADHFLLLNAKWGMEITTFDVSGASFITVSGLPTPNPGLWSEIDPIEKHDLMIHVKFFIEEVYNSDEYVLIGEDLFSPTPEKIIASLHTWLDEIDPETDSTIYVDIHQFFEPYLRDHLIDQQIGTIDKITDLNRRCRLEVWEYYDGQRRGKGYRSAPFRVIHGGLNKVDLPNFFGNLNNSLFLLSWSENDFRFLTYRPNERAATTDMVHSLYWLSWRALGEVGGNPEQIRLRATVYYTDGTNASQTLGTSVQIAVEETARLNVGFDSNFLSALEFTKTPYKYKVFIDTIAGATPGQRISREITYILEDPHYLHLYVHWRNSFGVEETTLFLGEQKLLTELEKDWAESQNQSQPGIMSEAGLGASNDKESSIGYNKRQTTTFTLETGAMSADELKAHADMLGSDFIYVQKPGGFQRTPLRIVPGSFEVGYKNQNGEHIYGVRFNARLEDDQNHSLITSW